MSKEESKNSEKKPVISEELAIKEVELFLRKWSKKFDPKIEIRDEYESMVDAIMSGRLVLDDQKKPTYTLLHPINPESELGIKTIEFKTRLKPSTRADLADGLNLQRQQAKFSLRLISYIIGQPSTMLDNFSLEDYDLIAEVAAVFMGGGR